MVIYLLENKKIFIYLDNNIFQSSNICKLVLHLKIDPSFSEHQYPNVVTVMYPSQIE